MLALCQNGIEISLITSSANSKSPSNFLFFLASTEESASIPTTTRVQVNFIPRDLRALFNASARCFRSTNSTVRRDVFLLDYWHRLTATGSQKWSVAMHSTFSGEARLHGYVYTEHDSIGSRWEVGEGRDPKATSTSVAGGMWCDWCVCVRWACCLCAVSCTTHKY